MISIVLYPDLGYLGFWSTCLGRVEKKNGEKTHGACKQNKKLVFESTFLMVFHGFHVQNPQIWTPQPKKLCELHVSGDLWLHTAHTCLMIVGPGAILKK